MNVNHEGTKGTKKSKKNNLSFWGLCFLQFILFFFVVLGALRAFVVQNGLIFRCFMKAVVEAIRQGETTLRFEIGENHSVVLGRTDESDWPVPYEKFLSRRHLELRMKSGRLTVKRLTDATNPVFHQGQEKEAFFIENGDQFVVGKTRFLFSLLSTRRDEVKPDLKMSMTPEEIYREGGVVSDRLRILDLLELPEILREKSDADSFTHIASLLRSVSGGAWSQIMRPGGKVMAVDSAMDSMGFKTSRTLIEEALKNAPHPFLYCWTSGDQHLSATLQEGADWAVCAASQIPGEEPLLFYVAGQGGNEPSLKDNCRLVGLIADMVGRRRLVRAAAGGPEGKAAAVFFRPGRHQNHRVFRRGRAEPQAH